METTRALLERHGQQHLLQFWDELSDNEKENLLKDIQDIDVEEVVGFYRRAIDSPVQEKLDGLLQPVPEDVYGSVARSNADVLADLEEEGLRQISESKVGVLLLAGGMGTRLGVSYPKGMYDIGLPSHKPLFQVQAERIRKLQNMAKARFGRRCAIPWYIMTSDATMENTAKFFEKNNYFGLEKQNIVMFEQGMMPCFTLDGKIILDEKSSVSRSPDGNGGLYRALRDRQVLADMTRRGVRYLHAHSVDNILVKVADPVFVGFCVQRGADCGAKVVEKTIPNEPLGVVCSVNGAFQVVEYSEITPATAARRNPDGRLTFHAGNICNHFFTTEFLLNVANEHEAQLKLHVAHKKIPFVNEAGERITPSEPNGIKIEKFVFDVFLFAKNLVMWEVPREEEFSAIKNGEGSSKDNAATARVAVTSLHRQYVERAGGTVQGDGLVEISPLLSYGGEGLEAAVQGKVLDTPLLLSAPEEAQQNGFH